MNFVISEYIAGAAVHGARCVHDTNKYNRNLGVRHINFRFNEEILLELTFRVAEIYICYLLVHLMSTEVWVNGRGSGTQCRRRS